MRLNSDESEAVEFLREYAREGFPRRVDGSFPSDFLTAMRRLMRVTPADMSIRDFERALSAGKDFDVVLDRRAWSWDDTKRTKEKLS